MSNELNYVRILNESLQDASPFEVLKLSVEKLFKKKLIYVCSFGAESAVILHMISRINKNLPIVLLNTNFLFKETIDYKNYLLEKLELNNFKEILPDERDLLNKDKRNLWKINPDLCCNIRKVQPLNKVLKGYNAWISGRKSYHNGERKGVKFFELLDQKIIINPLVDSDMKFIDNYFEKNKIERHPLFKKGFLSIGCTHCTKKTIDLENPRSGRWSDTTKTECGIHKNFYK
ncbi:MAG: phosphoadenylyl-sulfate reductase [Alphaproteobacteria bacterium]